MGGGTQNINGRRDKGTGARMSNDDQNARVIFLVGAGASVSFGIPHMAGMVESYLSNQTDEDKVAALQELLNIGVSQDLEQILLAIQTVLELPETALYNTIFQAVEAAPQSDRAEVEETFQERKQRLASVRIDILNWMSNTCLQFNRVAATAVWGKLVAFMAAHRISVFTTNYDFVVEQVAKLGELPVVDNFTAKPGKPGRWFWDETLRSFDEAGLRIIKLHGSVNWWETEEGGEIERLDAAVIKNQEGVDITRVQIFPTRFKDIYDSHFFTLYKRFIKELDAAGVLVVIGHSLRDEYIRAAIRERLRSSDFELIYIGPHLPDLGDFHLTEQQLATQVRHISVRFEDISDSMAYILEEYGIGQLASILEKLTRGDRRGDITLAQRITYMEPGDQYNDDVTIQALAIPPATLRAEIVNAETGASRGQPLEVTDSTGVQPVRVEGILPVTEQIRFQLPQDFGPGKYQVKFKLIQDDERAIVEKDYVWIVKGGETEEEAEESAVEEPSEAASDASVGSQEPSGEEIPGATANNGSEPPTSQQLAQSAGDGEESG